MIGQLDYETALHHISDQLLKAMGERCVDRKVRLAFEALHFACADVPVQSNVRDEALRGIGRLYGLAYSEMCVNGSHQ